MFKKLFGLKKPKKDFKTIQFYKYALSLEAIEELDINNIDINYLLTSSSEFLNQEKVLTSKQSKEYNIFKDKYNDYIDYCIESKFIKKDDYSKIEELKTISVPDMSKIKVPNLEKELEEMDIDLDKLANMFSKLSSK
jgi:hypothetical protein